METQICLKFPSKNQYQYPEFCVIQANLNNKKTTHKTYI